MDRRPLGRTGLSASPISFGAFKIGRNEKIKYAQGYALPSDTETERLLNGVLDLGINLIDTAPAYGTSEERMGKLISHRNRDFIVSTKVGEIFENGGSTYDFSRDSVVASVHRSLRRLRRDALDFVFVHANDDDLVLKRTDVAQTLTHLRAEGVIRFIGHSGKTVAGARLAMQWADALMIEYHPRDASHEPVLREAGDKGVAVFIKKPLASGAIPPNEALPFILRSPHLGTIVVGGLNLDHLKQNVAIASRSERATE
jgi:aryl-alcohol dehydrogenase-like predicted oxidoreductase